jgi:uncharacterized membrane protein
MGSGTVDLLLNILAPTRPLSVAIFIHLLFLFVAASHAPWRQLRVPQHLHVFLGSSISVLALWNIRTHFGLGTEFHLLGITAVTLVLEWPLAIIAATLAQLALALSAETTWHSYPMELVANGMVPVATTTMIHRLVRHKLPPHFFVYIFLSAFLGGALAMAASRLTLVAFAWAQGAANGPAGPSSLAYLPLMALPEALLNGMLVTVLVTYRPQWVSSFDDGCYLQGK